jgi:acyl carrier protein
MTSAEDAMDQARVIVARATGLVAADLPYDASLHTLAEWDSIAHINIMMAVESASGRQMDADDIAGIDSVPAIAAYLKRERGG